MFVSLLCMVGQAVEVDSDIHLRLGWDVPMERIDDVASAWTPDTVPPASTMPGSMLLKSLSAGYLGHAVWLRFQVPEFHSAEADDHLWLLAQPTYLDEVTLYQRSPSASDWRAQFSGDLIPADQKRHVRQHLFRLTPGSTVLLRIKTTSAMQFQGKILSDKTLERVLADSERNQGLYFGALLALLLGLVAAATIFKAPPLKALAILGIVSAAHLINVRGYTSLWIPTSLTAWASHAVSLGSFAIAAAVAWQVRIQLTAHSPHHRTDRFLVALTLFNVLCMASVPLNFYGDIAWMHLVSLLICDLIAVTLCLKALFSGRHRLQHAVLLMAYGLHTVSGGPLALLMLGQSEWDVDATSLWQGEALLFTFLMAFAVFLGMVRRYTRAIAAKDQAITRLAESEHRLEDRIALRTAELSFAQQALVEALQSERALRQEQHQFFNMISHEFRTPLAVIDSAAAEQQSFPSEDLENQTTRADQIRRACRRLTSMIDSCLVNDRMESAGFQLHPSKTSVPDMLEHAAQLVRWSPKHQLKLFTQATPAEWICDAALVRIALSNLVDNAVKYAKAGEIFIAASRNDAGLLEFAVADDGSGMSLEVMNKIFTQFERGDRTDQTRGFGLGLWVARRIARLHGGDISVESQLGHGSCFIMTIAAQRLPR